MDAMSTERQVGRVRHLSEDHLTPTGVGKLAPRAQVKRVVLTHLMLTGNRGQASLCGGEEVLFGSVDLARDLKQFQ
jgi:ribonuclease BN (tRNA processing enzyme)